MAESATNIDVSAIIIAHSEGRVLHACVTSFDRAAIALERTGKSVDRLLFLADPSDATLAWAERLRPPGWRLEVSDEKDLGRARNLAVAGSHGDYLAFMNGDDLTCADWLVKAFEVAAHSKPAVWHPELAIHFGDIANCSVQFHPDGATSDYDYAALADANPYSQGIFARRDVFTSEPFPEGDALRGLAFPDWHWNCEIVADGIHHRVVEETWHYVRLNNDGTSLTARSKAAKARIGPSRLFTGLLELVEGNQPPRAGQRSVTMKSSA